MLARTAASASTQAQRQARALLRGAAATRTLPRAAVAAGASPSASTLLLLAPPRRALSMAMGPGGGYPFLQSGACVRVRQHQILNLKKKIGEIVMEERDGGARSDRSVRSQSPFAITTQKQPTRTCGR